MRSCVLGNHDLHLLAVALVKARSCASAIRSRTYSWRPTAMRCSNGWLLRPLAHLRARRRRSAGACGRGATVERRRRRCRWPPKCSTRCACSRATLLSAMYGDEPDHWQSIPQGHGPPAFRDQRAHAAAILHRRRPHRFQAEGQARLGVAALDALVQDAESRQPRAHGSSSAIGRRSAITAPMAWSGWIPAASGAGRSRR